MEFTEDNLSKDLDNEELRNLILDHYDLDSLTSETMMDILREGAELNSFNRISESSFVKLMEALGIPLDNIDYD